MSTAVYRAEHREVLAASQRAYSTSVRRRNTVDVRALKLLRGCIDCGYDANADALEFDHRPGETKLGYVAQFKANDTLLREEIAKCDVRCANCHRIVTVERRHVQ